MKIARLSIKNFLGITEVDIRPGKVTVLAGKNGQGKSSILKALQAAFKGTTPQEIHKGTERAEIIVELDDLLITRVQTLKTSAVTVKTKDNFTRNAPQKFLDGLLGGFAFNPLAFLLADATARKAYLLKAMDVAVTRAEIQAAAATEDPIPVLDSGPALEQYAAAHRWCYDARSNINRTLKQKRGAIAETEKKLPAGEQFVPDDLVDEKLAAVGSRQEVLGRAIAGLDAEKRAAERAEKTRARIKEEQAVLRQERWEPRVKAAEAIKYTNADAEKAVAIVAELENKLRVAKENSDHIAGELRRKETLLAEAAGIEADIQRNVKTLEELPGAFDENRITEANGEAAGLDAERSLLEHKRRMMTVWHELRLLNGEAQGLEDDAHRLDQLVELFGKTLPAKALAEAKMPIKDLQFTDGGIYVGGIPIDDLATSEQVGVTLSIARALVPGEGLKTICIDGWERLDEEKQVEFIRLADGDGFQYLMTRVGRPAEGDLEVAGGKVVAQ